MKSFNLSTWAVTHRALVLFLIVMVVIRVMGEAAEKTSCPSCMEEVSIAASRCPHCTVAGQGEIAVI